MSMVSRKNATVINFAQSRVSIDFSCTVSKIQNTGHSCLIWEVVQARFRKKNDGQKLCAKSRTESSFDRFFVHRLGNSKYRPFTMYWPMVSRMSMVSRKNATVINFARSRVSIGFSCTVSDIQNTGHSRLISPSMLSQKNTMVINFARSHALSRVSIDFSCTISEIQNTGHSRCISP
ncbi:hypothetical protein B296_00042057 [Ensete ventricosum]|uniref:Uncharacterized protein n=1 Tax=Ensete ventricosum TaxID=4639 RepID=A0A426X250_ENSVE|nr:hypothetical protein B296_00042057 [Ensete ventricosum]